MEYLLKWEEWGLKSGSYRVVTVLWTFVQTHVINPILEDKQKVKTFHVDPQDEM
jgi:hypothetical protein